MLTSTPPENAKAVYEWISGFFNLEQGLIKRNFSLDTMKALAAAAGHPENCAPSLHVAGSKGKGSVTGMISSILEASGIKTARYVSPHVNDFRERLSLGSGFFSEEIYTRAGKELIELMEGSKFEQGKEPSFFELITLWFFLCARIGHCEAMAVETGMGGRLDATNILTPLASVITLIELEHTEYLGNTLAAIAGEKAGIIKPNRPLVLAGQSSEALDVFREHAARLNSPLFYFPDCAELQNIRVNKEGTSFTLILKNNNLRNPAFSDLFLPIPGEVQAKNAALAILAVKTAYPQIKDDGIYKGLESFTLPARFEKISEKPPMVIDGAHTKQSIEMCLKTFCSLYGTDGILIFGCVADKDVYSMAELCIPFFSKIFITTPGTFKKSLPEEIFTAFNVSAQKFNKAPEIIFLPETMNAVKKAVDFALEKGLPILATGSFYLAGDILRITHNTPDMTLLRQILPV